MACGVCDVLCGGALGVGARRPVRMEFCQEGDSGVGYVLYETGTFLLLGFVFGGVCLWVEKGVVLETC